MSNYFHPHVPLLLILLFLGCKTPRQGNHETQAVKRLPPKACVNSLELTTLLPPASIVSASLKVSDISITSGVDGTVHTAILHGRKSPLADFIYYEFCADSELSPCAIHGVVFTQEMDSLKNPKRDPSLMVAYEGRLLKGNYQVLASSCVTKERAKDADTNKAYTLGEPAQTFYCGQASKTPYKSEGNTPSVIALFKELQMEQENMFGAMGFFLQQLVPYEKDSSLPASTRTVIANTIRLGVLNVALLSGSFPDLVLLRGKNVSHSRPQSLALAGSCFNPSKGFSLNDKFTEDEDFSSQESTTPLPTPESIDWSQYWNEEAGHGLSGKNIAIGVLLAGGFTAAALGTKKLLKKPTRGNAITYPESTPPKGLTDVRWSYEDGWALLKKGDYVLAALDVEKSLDSKNYIYFDDGTPVEMTRTDGFFSSEDAKKRNHSIAELSADDFNKLKAEVGKKDSYIYEKIADAYIYEKIADGHFDYGYFNTEDANRVFLDAVAPSPEAFEDKGWVFDEKSKKFKKNIRINSENNLWKNLSIEYDWGKDKFKVDGEKVGNIEDGIRNVIGPEESRRHIVEKQIFEIELLKASREKKATVKKTLKALGSAPKSGLGGSVAIGLGLGAVMAASALWIGQLAEEKPSWEPSMELIKAADAVIKARDAYLQKQANIDELN